MGRCSCGYRICSATGLGRSERLNAGSDRTYSMLSQRRCWAIGKPWDTALEVGKHNVRYRTARDGLGILVLRLLDIQELLEAWKS